MAAGATVLGLGDWLPGPAATDCLQGWAVARKQRVPSPVTLADEQDIRAALGGDEDAFERIVSRYQPAVFSQMWHFSRDRDTVEELVQEVFIEVFANLAKFKGRAPFLHWVRRIATRVGYRPLETKEAGTESERRH